MTSPPWVEDHLRPGEEARWWVRPSMLGLLPVVASTVVGVVLAVTGIPLIGGGAAGVGALVSFSGVMLVAGALSSIGKQVIEILFTRYVVTEARFYAIRSFLSTRVESVPLERVSLVELRQGVVARALGLWTARVAAYGTAGTTIELPAIRNGPRLMREVNDGLRRGASARYLLRGD